MNIAIICDAATHLIAGSFVSTLRFAELLKKKGHKIIILASKGKSNKDIDFYKDIKVYRFPSVLIPKSEGQMYLFWASAKRMKDIFINENIDVVHIMIPMPSALSAIKAARNLNLKVIAHSHTQPENIFLHLPSIVGKNSLNNLFYKWMIYIYKKADIVICPSKFSEKKLKEHCPSLKTTVISNGVNLKKFKNNDYSSLFKKYKMKKGLKRILFVGRLHPEKNVDTLIKAMPIVSESYKNIHLDIVGAGHLYESLKELTNELHISKHVSLYGKVSDIDLIKFYSSADIFVLPSLAELEGMVVLEAMACGKPIIIANSKESASVYFVKNNGFLFEPENEKDLAKKILIIIKNDALRKKMSAESLKESRKYDINESVKKIEEVYKRKYGRKIFK